MKVNSLRLEKYGKNAWLFIWPEDPEEEKYFEAGQSALDNGENEKARVCFKEALRISPWRFDILTNLAFTEKNSSDYEKRVQEAVNAGLKFFPKEFDFDSDLLEWGFHENRPFLRAYHNLGLVYWTKQDFANAIKCFKQILVWNPNDNQGVRGILADIFVFTKNWLEMIELAKKYEDDSTPSILFGNALALFKFGKIIEAENAIQEAVEFNPLCAKELLKNKHKKPKNASDEYVTSGGKDEAFEFWEHQGRASTWQEKDVKKWLKTKI
ncbi:MAG: tetratricopeptide repeat protein [Candidatus Micrarchaeota archaeon]